jgi:hypothetical protein
MLKCKGNHHAKGVRWRENFDPLTVIDCSLVTDGSAFIVVSAATEVAKKITKQKI